MRIKDSVSRFIVGPNWYHPGDIVEIPEEYYQEYMMEKVVESTEPTAEEPVVTEEPASLEEPEKTEKQETAEETTAEETDAASSKVIQAQAAPKVRKRRTKS